MAVDVLTLILKILWSWIKRAARKKKKKNLTSNTTENFAKYDNTILFSNCPLSIGNNKSSIPDNILWTKKFKTGINKSKAGKKSETCNGKARKGTTALLKKKKNPQSS